MFVARQVRVAPATVAARQVVSSATMFVVSQVRVAAAVVARPIRRAAVVLRPSSRSVARLVNSAAATTVVHLEKNAAAMVVVHRIGHAVETVVVHRTRAAGISSESTSAALYDSFYLNTLEVTKRSAQKFFS